MQGIAVPIVLLVLGVLAFFLEAFIPSGGAITIVGVGCVIAADAVAFTSHGATAGVVFLALSLVLVPASFVAAFALLPRTPIGKRLTLRSTQTPESGYVAQDSSEQALIGQRGVAVSTLRPAGEAKIGDRRYGVMTEGELVESGAEIEVRRVEGNRIVVRQVKTEA